MNQYSTKCDEWLLFTKWSFCFHQLNLSTFWGSNLSVKSKLALIDKSAKKCWMRFGKPKIFFNKSICRESRLRFRVPFFESSSWSRTRFESRLGSRTHPGSCPCRSSTRRPGPRGRTRPRWRRWWTDRLETKTIFKPFFQLKKKS